MRPATSEAGRPATISRVGRRHRCTGIALLVLVASACADRGPTSEVVELPGPGTPLEDGSAPEGYQVKGNANSGLYHEPDGQWYEQTDAEFWFKSAEDAEAAGFKKAGSGD